MSAGAERKSAGFSLALTPKLKQVGSKRSGAHWRAQADFASNLYERRSGEKIRRIFSCTHADPVQGRSKFILFVGLKQKTALKKVIKGVKMVTAAIEPKKQSGLKRQNRKELWKYIKRHKWLYAMLLPAAVYYIIFCYIPMYGATMALKDFNPRLGILGSPWVGFEVFRELFGMEKFYSVFWNTISISFTRLIFGFPFPIIIALLLNALRSHKLKKVVQTSIYIPNFISWVILGGILTNLLSSDGGAVNAVITALGFAPIPFLTSEKFFIPTIVASMIWKTFGWSTIIYLAALAGVDPQYYEAATVDGANRWHKLWYITLPAIRSTIIVVLITRIGSLMQAGFEQIFVLYHPGVYGVADIIDTYVYRVGIFEGKFELAAAVGLFKSIVNFLLLVMANRAARHFGEEGIF